MSRNHEEIPLRDILQLALEEDLAPQGDLTSNLIFSPEDRGEGRFVSRARGVLAGGCLLPHLYDLRGGDVSVEDAIPDGSPLREGDTIARVEGPMRALLSVERLALNLMGRASGIATATRLFVDAARGASKDCRIVDTRKTTPLLRSLERHAVRMGGGVNHRFNLSTGILIKDNHIAGAGGVARAIEAVRAGASHLLKIEVEVEDEDQAAEAVRAGADALLLDNMDTETMARIAEEYGASVVLEASGGMTLGRIPEVAAAGVHLISVGALTHSAPCLDLSFEVLGRRESREAP